MTRSSAYPKILRAVRDSQLSVWAIVDAIIEDAARSRGGNRMRDGEAERISDYLRKNGYRLSVTRIRHLYAVGWWVKDHPLFREHSVTRVIYVMNLHRNDYSQAARTIRSTTTGRTLKRDTMTPLTAIQKANRYLNAAAKALKGARYTDDEWDELQVAADSLIESVAEVQTLIGSDFAEAIEQLREKNGVKTDRQSR